MTELCGRLKANITEQMKVSLKGMSTFCLQWAVKATLLPHTSHLLHVYSFICNFLHCTRHWKHNKSSATSFNKLKRNYDTLFIMFCSCGTQSLSTVVWKNREMEEIVKKKKKIPPFICWSKTQTASAYLQVFLLSSNQTFLGPVYRTEL